MVERRRYDSGVAIKQMPDCALPDHLKGKLHDDYIFPFNRISRGWNSFGPRCGPGNPGYKIWPPRLLEGFGVARWENDGASSILFLPSLANRRISADRLYGFRFEAVEMNPGHPDYNQSRDVNLNWVEGMNIPHQYHPSALQKFSTKGWMRCEPHYYARWKVLKKREPEKDDIVLFFREGFRVDSLDIYYSLGPFAGLHWE